MVIMTAAKVDIDRPNPFFQVKEKVFNIKYDNKVTIIYLVSLSICVSKDFIFESKLSRLRM